MARAVRFGVTLPQIKRTWAEVRAAALEFDRLGFDSVWVCDHLYGVPLPNLPIFEAWSELAAVAAITERVELGTLVTPPFFRNPAVLADRKSTRLNSSHVAISYAVFCLKKKRKKLYSHRSTTITPIGSSTTRHHYLY